MFYHKGTIDSFGRVLCTVKFPTWKSPFDWYDDKWGIRFVCKELAFLKKNGNYFSCHQQSIRQQIATMAENSHSATELHAVMKLITTYLLNTHNKRDDHIHQSKIYQQFWSKPRMFCHIHWHEQYAVVVQFAVVQAFLVTWMQSNRLHSTMTMTTVTTLWCACQRESESEGKKKQQNNWHTEKITTLFIYLVNRTSIKAINVYVYMTERTNERTAEWMCKTMCVKGIDNNSYPRLIFNIFSEIIEYTYYSLFL